MGFSVVPKELQYLTPAEVLLFKLLGCCRFPSSSATRESSQTGHTCSDVK